VDDPYGIRPNYGPGQPEPFSRAHSRPEPRDRTAGALWATLAVFVGLNAVFSIAKPDDVLFSLVFGIPAVLCLVMLAARYLGRRRS
jgi:hypothetical protein